MLARMTSFKPLTSLVKGTLLLIPTLLATGCASTSEESSTQSNSSDVVVLEYYPDCNYQVLGTVNGQSGISEADYLNSNNALLKRTVPARIAKGRPALTIKELKVRAQQLGADAIAITDYQGTKERIKLTSGKFVRAEKHTMRAEAIKLCGDKLAINTPNDKPVKYNEFSQLSLEKSLPTKVALERVEIEPQPIPVRSKGLLSENIEINGKVLGFHLGTSKRDLFNQLGEPSAIITLSSQQQALLYGRKHLFFFDSDKLVGYEHKSSFLPLHLSNHIEYPVELDEANIVINKELTIGSLLKEVSASIHLKAPMLRKGTLRIQNTKTMTRLSFTRPIGARGNTDNYQLNGISVYQRGYQPFNWQSVVAKAGKTTYLDLQNSLLDSQSNIEKADVIATLGLPDITIKKARLKDTWVYGNELIVDFLRGTMLKYTLESNSTKLARQKCNPCLYLGQLKSEIPVQYVTMQSQRQITLESNGFSYLVALSDGNSPKVDDIQVYLKR